MSEKVGIFGGIKYSIKGLFRPKFFNRLSNQSKAAGIGFTIFVTIFTTIIYWGLTYLVMLSGTGMVENVRKQLILTPNFNYTNGAFTCNEFYMCNSSDETKYFLMDASVGEASDSVWQEYIIKTDWKNGKTIVVFNGQTFAVKTGFGATFKGRYTLVTKLLGINNSADRGAILNSLQMIALRCCIVGLIVTLPLFVLLSIAVSYIFGGLGFAFNKIVRGTYSFNDCVMIAMYIAPFPMFIARLMSAAPIDLKMWIIALVVSLIFLAYMYFALTGSQEDVGPSSSVVFNKPDKTVLSNDTFDDSVRSSRRRGSAFAPSNNPQPVADEEKQLDRAQETVRKYLSENPVPGVNFKDGNFASEVQPEAATETQYAQNDVYVESAVQPEYTNDQYVQSETYEEQTYSEPEYEEPAYEEPAYEEPVYTEPVAFKSKFETESSNVSSSRFDASASHTYDQTTTFKSKFESSESNTSPIQKLESGIFGRTEPVTSSSEGLSFASKSNTSQTPVQKEEGSAPRIIKSDLTYGVGYSSSAASGGRKKPKYDRPVTAPDAYDGFNYGGSSSSFESDPLSDSGSSGSLLYNREGLYGKTLSVGASDSPAYASSASTLFVSKRTDEHPDLSRPYGSLYNNNLDNTTSSGLTFTSATTGGVPFADNTDPFRTKVPTYSPVKNGKKPKRYEDDFTKWEREHYS